MCCRSILGVVTLCWLCTGAGKVVAAYTYLYGGVLAENIENVSASDSGASRAIRVALEHAKLEGTQYSVTNLEKQRLYYTSDGISPAIRERFSKLDGRVQLHRDKFVLGLMYTFSITHDETEYQFVISRDRNKDNHVFKMTSLRTPELSQVSSSSSPEGHCRSAGKDVCVLFSPLSLLGSQFHPAGFRTSGGAAAVRIVSYNIWNLNKIKNIQGETYESRLNRMGRFIKSLNADVIGFQEVRLEANTKTSSTTRRKGEKVATQFQVEHLTGWLPEYHYVYQPAMFFVRDWPSRKEEGLAIFSRYPILSSDHKILFRNDSDDEDYHQRICLHAELLVRGFEPVHVFVSHLSLSEAARERSVVEIWNFMQTFPGTKVLMGDMNAEPDSNAIRFLAGKAPLENVWTSNLQDSWEYVNAVDGPGLTFSALEDEPIKRIDYIFVNLPDSSVHISSSDVVIDENACFPPCSDHHLLLTTIDLKTNH